MTQSPALVFVVVAVAADAHVFGKLDSLYSRIHGSAEAVPAVPGVQIHCLAGAAHTLVDGHCYLALALAASHPMERSGEQVPAPADALPAVQLLREAIVPGESRRQELPELVLVALAVESSSHIVLGIQKL